jgi:beta-galactosidase
MTFGGTSWGHSAAPVVYTSYDYSAPLRETRQQWDKLFQTKLVNMFATSSSELLQTEMVGNGTGFRVSADTFSWVLENPTTGTTFTVIQQNKTPSRVNITTPVTLETSEGTVTASDVALAGRQSKILVTDYTFGSHKLLYATADILTHGIFDKDVLVFYLQAGQKGEFALKGERNLTFTSAGNSKLSSSKSGTQQVFAWTQGAGTTAVTLSNGVLVYLLEQATAWHFWAPSTTALDPFAPADKKLFVMGPYLVRSASISHQVLHISGDSDVTTLIEVYVGSTTINTIDWNGRRLPATKTSYGSYTATIPGAEDRTVSLPSLERWHSADSLPEADPAYDDSRWTVCNKTTTLSPIAPLTLPVLFSSDYGYYAGAKIYRGYFPSTANATSVNITASGGLAFGWNAWLNGIHIGGHVGDPALTTTNLVLTFPSNTTLKPNNNVLTVLVDYHGHDEASTAKGVENPRGLLGAALLPSGTSKQTGFTTWKITGAAGSNSPSGPPDMVRGPMNEGGLHFERLGWHLPGFEPSGPTFSMSSTSTPFTGIATAGVRYYTTTFHLNIDSDLDVPLGIEFSAPAGTTARVLLYVNGYQYGKYVPHIGPQTRFPVPPGVINNRGANTIGISLWAQTDEGAKLDEVKLISYGAYQTDFGFNQDWSALQPGWTDRSQYA